MSVNDYLENGKTSINVYNLTVDGAETVAGNLTVTGETTTVDNLVVLGTITGGGSITETNPGAPIYQLNAGGLSASEVVGNPSAVVLPGAQYIPFQQLISAPGTFTVATVPPDFRAYIVSWTIYNQNLVTTITSSMSVLNPAGVIPGTYQLTTDIPTTALSSTSNLCNYVYGENEGIVLTVDGGTCLFSFVYALFPDDGTGSLTQNPFQMQSELTLVQVANTPIFSCPAVTPRGAPVSNAFGVLVKSAQPAASVNQFGVDNTQQLLGPMCLTVFMPTANTLTITKNSSVIAVVGITGSNTITQIPLQPINEGSNLSVSASFAEGQMWVSYFLV